MQLKILKSKLTETSRSLGATGTIKAGLEFGVTAAELEKLNKSGWRTVFFIAKDAFAHYGLRVLPGLPQAQWSVVKVLQYNRAVTHAPNLQALLLFQRVLALSGNETNLGLLQQTWDEHLQFLQPFFEHLPFPTSEAALFFQKIQDLRDAKVPDAVYLTLWSSFGTTGFERVALQLAALKTGNRNDVFVPLPEAPDVWTARSAHLNVQALAGFDPATLKNRYRDGLLDTLLRLTPTDVETPTVKTQPNSATEHYMHYPMNLQLWSDFMPRDGEALGEMLFFLIEKIAEKDKHHYAGTAHLECAVLLDEGHDKPFHAWDMLCNAFYWAGKNRPEVLPAVTDAARSFAQKRSWTDIVNLLS